MEKVKKIIGLAPDEIQTIEARLVEEITRISQCTNTQHIVTFVLERDKGDHQFPVLAQISNVDSTLWLNNTLLPTCPGPEPINVNNLRIRCQKAFKVSTVAAKIDTIIKTRFLNSPREVQNLAKDELVKLFLEI